MSRTGLVLEGGAFRGVFTSGVLDVLMENNISTDYVVGVSAGAGNGMGFVSRQIGRTRNVIKPWDSRVNYFGMKQVLTHGKFLNLNVMFYDYPYKQFPYDFDEFKKSPIELEVVVANCDTGKAEYYDERENIDKFLKLGMASCSVPILCKPVEIDGMHYLDGSICDSIPVERAVEKGCDRILVIMTKNRKEAPTNYKKMKAVMAMKYGRKFPKFYQALLERTDVYKRQLKVLKQLEKEGRVIVLRPDMECIKKFEQDNNKVEEFYQNGRKIAEENLDRIKEFFGVSNECTCD